MSKNVKVRNSKRAANQDVQLAREVARAIFAVSHQTETPEKRRAAWNAEREDRVRAARQIIRRLKQKQVSLSIEQLN